MKATGDKMAEGIFHNMNCEPEIVISYLCNLDFCSYCYARDQKIDDVMSVPAFNDVLGWFKDIIPSLKGITLLGGEPTIIPNLEDYLKVAEFRNLFVSFFTNGSFDQERSKMLAENHAVKTLYFHLEPLHFKLIPNHAQSFTRNIRDIKSLNKEVKLRVNFHGAEFDYELPLAIASEYSLPIAWSITSPGKSMQDYVRRRDIRKVGERLGQFFDKARDSGLILELVRPTPICTFPEEIFNEFRDYTSLDRHCNVSTYVHPNLQVQFCTVLDNTRTGPVKNAKDLEDAILKFQQMDKGVRALPSFDTCPSCDNHKTEKCQGGCLSYKVFGDHT